MTPPAAGRAISLLSLLLCAAGATAHGQVAPPPAEPPLTVPAHNRADQKQAPPRPAAASAEQVAERLFDAIVRDDVEAAAPLFFPRAAFLLVKDIADPGRYYDQLYKRFGDDIHALHKSLPALSGARFERFELSQRGGFVRVHEEANKLPYWAARHNTLYYRSGDVQHKIEVRVMITWDDRWYVVHLNMFRAIDR